MIELDSPSTARHAAAGLPLDAFADAARRLDAPSFAARYGSAFLLHQGPIPGAVQPWHGAEPTLVSESRHRDRNVDLPLVAFAVRRRPGQAAGPVTLGRAADCDVVLADASVSKLHALARESASGELVLEDARSQNGTYVDDRPAPIPGRGDPLPLRSGAVVRLGSIELTFVSVDELVALVRALVPEPG